MIALSPCREWDYENTPGYEPILRANLAIVLAALGRRSVTIERDGVDTRPTHQILFANLTPAGHEYFAGHYREEDFPCLVDYIVVVPADPLVGVHYDDVAGAMYQFAGDLLRVVAALDASFASPEPTLSEETKLYRAVVGAARAFQELLTIHPFANGNGHVARFIVWLLLSRYNYWPRAWTIHPRPRVTDYSRALSDHRRGAEDALEKLILQAMVQP